MVRMGKSPYNKTHLSLDLAEERMIIHRDYLGHVLRWSHVIKHADIGETILDLGCADGPMAMAFYTNRYKPKSYLGIDIRDSMVAKGRKKMEKVPWAEFMAVDLVKDFGNIPKRDYTKIVCFEMIEHIPGETVEPLLKNVASLMTKKTKFFLSTPCFDGVNQAANHLKEWYFKELKDVLERHFKIEEVYGTFMSQKDLKKAQEEGNKMAKVIFNPVNDAEDQYSLFDALRGYYDSNLLAVIFAPLFPSYSRNAIWRLVKKP